MNEQLDLMDKQLDLMRDMYDKLKDLKKGQVEALGKISDALSVMAKSMSDVEDKIGRIAPLDSSDIGNIRFRMD